MVTRLRVTIRGKNYDIVGATKADIARALFEAPENYSVSEVSKAVPMAYSQAHSIRKGMVEVGGKPSKDYKLTKVKKAEAEVEHAISHLLDANINNKRRRDAARAIVGSRKVPDEIVPAGAARHARNVTPKAKAVVWKGTCGNCGRPIEARMVGQQNTFVHVNVDPADYVKEVQFCQAFPKGLI